MMPFLPKNHFHNQKYGPFSEDRDEQGRLLSPYDPPGREPIGESTTHLEPPARVRYPVKRITTAEIRKRVKNVSEYVGRVQHEEGRRKERAKLLGIDVKSLPAPAKFDDTGDVMMDETSAEEHPRETEIQTPKPDIASSTKLMDDLTRDLLALQDTFAPGGFASPFPLPIPRFPTQSPITTTLASGSAIDQHEPVAGVFGVEDTVEQVGQDEMVDVYREGEVGIVITQEIEQQAADAVGAAAEAEVAVV